MERRDSTNAFLVAGELEGAAEHESWT